LGVATGGLSEGARFLDPARPYAEAAKLSEASAGEYGALAREQRAYQEQGLGRVQQAYQGLQGLYSQMYGPGGEGAGPGALESYYMRTAAGQDPYFNRILEQGRAGLTSQMSQAGGVGSGARLAALGNLTSGLQAQMYRERGQMAAAAQAAQQARLGQQFGAQAGLSGAQAGLIGDFYGRAGQLYGQGMESAIGARAHGRMYGTQAGMARQQAIWEGLRTGAAFLV
jgi:hypothetical protein